jgi:hypothetical protein
VNRCSPQSTTVRRGKAQVLSAPDLAAKPAQPDRSPGPAPTSESLTQHNPIDRQGLRRGGRLPRGPRASVCRHEGRAPQPAPGERPRPKRACAASEHADHRRPRSTGKYREPTSPADGADRPESAVPHAAAAARSIPSETRPTPRPLPGAFPASPEHRSPHEHRAASASVALNDCQSGTACPVRRAPNSILLLW